MEKGNLSPSLLVRPPPLVWGSHQSERFSPSSSSSATPLSSSSAVKHTSVFIIITTKSLCGGVCVCVEEGGFNSFFPSETHRWPCYITFKDFWLCFSAFIRWNSQVCLLCCLVVKVCMQQNRRQNISFKSGPLTVPQTNSRRHHSVFSLIISRVQMKADLQTSASAQMQSVKQPVSICFCSLEVLFDLILESRQSYKSLFLTLTKKSKYQMMQFLIKKHRRQISEWRNSTSTPLLKSQILRIKSSYHIRC